VCSLWNVRDNHTKTFMVEFYKNVLAGKSYPDALQSAKLTMLSGPETLLPLLWAGFVVLGR
jgi:CHAT domain-containing protein